MPLGHLSETRPKLDRPGENLTSPLKSMLAAAASVAAVLTFVVATPGEFYASLEALSLLPDATSNSRASFSDGPVFKGTCEQALYFSNKKFWYHDHSITWNEVERTIVGWGFYTGIDHKADSVVFGKLACSILSQETHIQLQVCFDSYGSRYLAPLSFSRCPLSQTAPKHFNKSL